MRLATPCLSERESSLVEKLSRVGGGFRRRSITFAGFLSFVELLIIVALLSWIRYIMPTATDAQPSSPQAAAANGGDGVEPASAAPAAPIALTRCIAMNEAPKKVVDITSAIAVEQAKLGDIERAVATLHLLQEVSKYDDLLVQMIAQLIQFSGPAGPEGGNDPEEVALKLVEEINDPFTKVNTLRTIAAAQARTNPEAAKHTLRRAAKLITTTVGLTDDGARADPSPYASELSASTDAPPKSP